MDDKKEQFTADENSSFLHLFWQRISRLKPAETSVAQSSGPRTLGWLHLLAYGIAAAVGSGIYAVVGDLAKDLTGPAVVFSVLGAGTLALLTALCYLELAMMIPASGSSYIYGYTIFGELTGFLMGWTATLEYSFAGSVIAISMMDYLVKIVASLGGTVPTFLYAIPEDPSSFPLTVNMLAAILVLAVTLVVLKGVAFGAKVNAGLTIINLSILVLIISVGAACIKVENYTPFFPYSPVQIFHGAAQMMFCYIGFDTVCNLTGDAKRPADLRIAVVGTVTVATVLYAAVALVMTGMVPYADLVPGTSLSSAFQQVGIAGVAWVSHVVRVLAFMMMFATLLACLMGQPKLFQMMAKDGFLPALFDRENGEGIALANILLSGAISAIVALAIKKGDIVDLTALGGLITFSVNAAGLLLTRLRRHPTTNLWGTISLAVLFVGSLITFSLFHTECETAFFVTLPFLTIIPAIILIALCFKYREAILILSPLEASTTETSLHWSLLPIVPVLSIVGNAMVIPTLPAVIFLQYVVWLALGLSVYLAYGYKHSVLHRKHQTDEAPLV